MRLWSLMFVLLAACYEAPSTTEPCAITCTTSCPGGLSCEGGFCVGPGQICDPSYTQVAAGTGFACAIDDKGALWCWGSNQHHQIDPGDRLQFPLATRIGARTWDAIDAGGGHICGISDGALLCWGQNDHAQVAPISGDVSEPFEIAVTDGPSRWTAVSASFQSTCAIGDGRVYCWGREQYGSFGTGDPIGFRDYAEPTLMMTTATDFTAVSVGVVHMCAVSPTAGLLCTGLATYGAVGPNGGAGFVSTPVVAMPPPVTAVGVSSYATCAVDGAGALFCFGDNARGELGEDNLMLTTTSTPTLATAITGWTSVTGDENKLCGLTMGGAVYCWGASVIGGLGGGVWIESKRWQKVINTGASSVTLGWQQNTDAANIDRADLELGCALVGTDVQCWGDNRFGQLGRGGTTMVLAPVEIAGDHRFRTLALGDSHGCGLEGETLHCWGATNYGASTAVTTGATTPRTPCMPNLDCDLGTPKALSFVTSVDDVVTGLAHTCALANDVISCWGYNNSGQLGTGAPGPIRRSVPQAGGRPWTTLFSTGREGQCASPGGTEVWCWGNVLTIRNAPARETALDGFRELDVGTSFLCGRDGTDQLQCKGANASGQFGTLSPGFCLDGACNSDETPATCPQDCGVGPLTALNRSYSAITVSTYGEFACGIRSSDQRIECWGSNDRGQTGAFDPSTNALVDPTYLPAVLEGPAQCTDIAAGYKHTCAICAGAVQCWGDQQDAQLGNGVISATPEPVPHPLDLRVEGDAWAQIEAGFNFTCARSEQGRTFCWGTDAHAGLGNGATSANLPVTVTASPIE